ncbi:GTP-binding protein EsdC [Purpureocillium lavendulum]|uniref:GTP-binding protein EsdC n=1 Tax=Purpureocillium lavendulum TaxID=1247861 RepID=A0AB34FMK6_9HYPO|nr:GTP-binding protein EsdC [Purpureocillium lavendulum]
MSAIQLSFSLRVSSGVKTVHLLGSWDNYVGQLPLSKDKSSSKSGSWKGTFRFQNSTLEAGQRYWYYYIIDGYHVAHNPSVTSTTEPTTGRELNILDVPADKHRSSSKSSSSSSSSSHRSSSSKSSSSSSHKSSSSKSSSSSSRHHSSSKDHHRSSRNRASLSVDIPKGRPLSVSQIQAPKPMSPHATKHILDSDYCDNEALEELTARFGSTGFEDDDAVIISNFGASPVSSTGSSLSYRSDSSSPSSQLSGYSTPNSDCSTCTCERYGITRKGERVKLDCGGAHCGYGEDTSSCSSGASEDEYEAEVEYSRHHHHQQASSSRRHGIVVG